MVATSTQDLGIHLQSFTDFERVAAGRNLPWLRKLREGGFARFAETGFPTTHDEDWRFTNVAPIARTPFALPPAGQPRLSGSIFERSSIEGAAAELVFMDGKFVREWSVFKELLVDVFASGLNEAIVDRPAEVASHFGRYLDIRRDPFSALNTAFAEDGAYLRIERGVVLEAPIHLLFVSTANDAPTMIHPRNLLVFEDE